LCFVIVLWAKVLCAQSRFGDEYPRLAGFLKSPTEHILDERATALIVRLGAGRVVDSAAKEGIPGVILELKYLGRIRTFRTGREGQLLLRDLREGSYLFKATRDGFQSIVGILKITRGSSEAKAIYLEMNPGA
jgi:hypothetical protein